MKKKIKFTPNQAELIAKSIDAFKSETVKNVARSYFGGTGEDGGREPVGGHSKGSYSQTYSKLEVL